MDNYLKYRGKCRELCDALIKENPDLILVRGWYYEPLWSREEQHWWCKDKEGNIHDPSHLQFPSCGVSEFYREFKGLFNCSNCDKEVKEEDIGSAEGRYVFCSHKCHGKFIGVL